jgi:hypothetical protein
MKNSVYEQFAIVREDSASLFTARLNETIYKLRDKQPKVTFSESDPLCAYVHYIVNENVPETVAEASAVEGISFVCAQCPYFKPITTQDGEVDKRRSYGDCEFAELGRVKKTSPACDKLFEAIKEGDVRLCFID